MSYLVLADMTVLVHAAFVIFVVFGGIAVLRWRRLAWFHLPAAVWGVVIEIGGWVCPLTFVENRLRRLGGEAGYSGTFIERYLEPLLYPLGLTRNLQLVFAIVAFLVNFAVYASLWRRSSRNLQ